MTKEFSEWGDVTFSTHNQWRCDGTRPDGRSCNRLLAVANADHTALYVKRKDSTVYFFDLGGSGVLIECPGCGYGNSLFSDGVDLNLLDRDFKQSF